MSPTTDATSTEAIFDQVQEVLAVPASGSPIPESMKWIVPCPDQIALKDHPAEADLKKEWRKNYTTCENKQRQVAIKEKTKPTT